MPPRIPEGRCGQPPARARTQPSATIHEKREQTPHREQATATEGTRLNRHRSPRGRAARQTVLPVSTPGEQRQTRSASTAAGAQSQETHPDRPAQVSGAVPCSRCTGVPPLTPRSNEMGKAAAPGLGRAERELQDERARWKLEKTSFKGSVSESSSCHSFCPSRCSYSPVSFMFSSSTPQISEKDHQSQCLQRQRSWRQQTLSAACRVRTATQAAQRYPRC